MSCLGHGADITAAENVADPFLTRGHPLESTTHILPWVPLLGPSLKKGRLQINWLFGLSFLGKSPTFMLREAQEPTPAAAPHRPKSGVIS